MYRADYRPLSRGLYRPLNGLIGGADLDLDYAGTGRLLGPEVFTRGSAAWDYDSTGKLVQFASGVPRFAYDPVSKMALGLRIEESRTNLALQSNQFDTTWALSTDAAVASAAGVSPDGSSNAWKLKEGTTTSAGHSARQSVTKAASSLAYSYSVFAKAAERARVQLEVFNGANGVFAIFDLAGGHVGVAQTTFGTGFTTGASTIQSIGNGWYRCTINVTSDTTTGITARLDLDSGSGTAPASTSYSGTIGSGVLIYGAQLEQAAFPSTYIPTTTAAVTRAADVATIALSSVGIPANPTGLTIIGKARTAVGYDSAKLQYLWQIDDGSTTNRLFMRRTAATSGPLFLGNGGTVNSTIYATPPVDSTLQFWAAFALNDVAGQVIGQSKQVVVTVPSLPTGLTTLEIGNFAGASFWGSTIARLKLFNRRLPDADSASIAASL